MYDVSAQSVDEHMINVHYDDDDDDDDDETVLINSKKSSLQKAKL